MWWDRSAKALSDPPWGYFLWRRHSPMWERGKGWGTCIILSRPRAERRWLRQARRDASPDGTDRRHWFKGARPGGRRGCARLSAFHPPPTNHMQHVWFSSPGHWLKGTLLGVGAEEERLGGGGWRRKEGEMVAWSISGSSHHLWKLSDLFVSGCWLFYM